MCFKKSIMIFLSLAILTLNSAYAEEYKSEALSRLTVKSAVSLGTPAMDLQILGNCIKTRTDGTTAFYGVTSGPPAKFFVYNIDTGKIEDEKILQTSDGKSKSKVCYAVDMGNDGIINLATQSDAIFYRYNPNNKELKCYGKVFSGTAVMSAGYCDSVGNYFFGVYPDARLIKYDKKQDKLIDLGTMLEGEDYINAVGGYGTKIFMGGRGNPVTQFVKYDTASGKKTVLSNPSLDGVFTSEDVGSYHAASVAGKYLFARVKLNNLNSSYMCVFDMSTETWIDFIPGTLHLHPTKFENGLVYYHSSIGGGKAALYSYDVKTKQSQVVEGIELSSSDYLVKPAFATLKDQVNFPGRTIIAGANSKGIACINLETKKVKYIKDGLPQMPNNIRNIKGGYNGDIIVSVYMGAKVVIYDSENEKIRMEAPSVQIEGINVFDNKYYFGLYGKGRLTEFNPYIDGSSSNPKQIAHMSGYEQDRAFNVVDGGENIIWGTYPDYGRLGGAVGVYNKATKKYKIYPKPIENQAMAGLAYRSGKIYGSTSVYGGLGIDAIDDYAKIFIMDLATGNVEKTVDVKLKTDSNKQYFIGDLKFDSDGRLWAGAAQTLIELDPETLDIIREIPIGSGRNTLTKVRALPYRLEIGEDGLLYTNIGNRITAVDPKTGEIKQLSNSSTIGITLASDNNLYYIGTNTNYLYRMELNRGEPEKPIAVNNMFETNEDVFLNGRIEKGPKLGAFATVFEKEGYTVKEYGMVLSDTDDKPEIGKTSCSKYPALVPKNSLGQFGILFCGVNSSSAYFGRPYVIYSKDGVDITMYGKTICSKLQ